MTHIDVLTHEILTAFVDKIEIGPKEFEGGLQKATHRNTPFRQSIKIHYRFIGELEDASPEKQFPCPPGADNVRTA